MDYEDRVRPFLDFLKSIGNNELQLREAHRRVVGGGGTLGSGEIGIAFDLYNGDRFLGCFEFYGDKEVRYEGQAPGIYRALIKGGPNRQAGKGRPSEQIILRWSAADESLSSNPFLHRRDGWGNVPFVRE